MIASSGEASLFVPGCERDSPVAPSDLDCLIGIPPHSDRLNPVTTGNPFLGTKLLGFCIGRGSGALKGLMESDPENRLQLLTRLEPQNSSLYVLEVTCAQRRVSSCKSVKGLTSYVNNRWVCYFHRRPAHPACVQWGFPTRRSE